MIEKKTESVQEAVEIMNQETGEVKSRPTFYKFEHLQLHMKEGVWYLDMLLNAHIPKLYMTYVMHWVVDLAKIEEALEEIYRTRENHKDGLLPDENDRMHANFAKQENRILNQKAEMIKKYGDIAFECMVEKMANKTTGDTQITFKIPSDMIEKLNYYRMDAEENYKIFLTQM